MAVRSMFGRSRCCFDRLVVRFAHAGAMNIVSLSTSSRSRPLTLSKTSIL